MTPQQYIDQHNNEIRRQQASRNNWINKKQEANGHLQHWANVVQKPNDLQGSCPSP
jgi:hypothetical protein